MKNPRSSSTYFVSISTTPSRAVGVTVIFIAGPMVPKPGSGVPRSGVPRFCRPICRNVAARVEPRNRGTSEPLLPYSHSHYLHLRERAAHAAVGVDGDIVGRRAEAGDREAIAGQAELAAVDRA